MSTQQMVNIPKIILQVSKYKKHKLFKTLYKNYEYYHFTDSEILDFIKFYAVEKMFPGVLNTFTKLKRGQHKSDLFRYIFLYLNGGIYIDTDIELLTDINNIVTHEHFVSVFTPKYSRGFNGFIAVSPKNAVILKCLKHMLSIDTLAVKYFDICKYFGYTFNQSHQNQKILVEKIFYKYSLIYDNDIPVMIHHYKNKDYPYQQTIKNQKTSDYFTQLFDNKDR